MRVPAMHDEGASLVTMRRPLFVSRAKLDIVTCTIHHGDTLERLGVRRTGAIANTPKLPSATPAIS